MLHLFLVVWFIIIAHKQFLFFIFLFFPIYTKNAETLDVKPPKKAERCESKENYIACLEHLLLFSMLSH